MPLTRGKAFADLKELPYVDIRTYGATESVGASAEAAAILSDKVVAYPITEFAGVEDPANLYGSTIHKKGLMGRYQRGVPSRPTSDAAPVAWFQKFSNSNRTTVPTNWDQGGVYSSLIKTAGDSYGAGLTGYAKHTGGSGQVIGVHGRGQGTHADAEVWGGWSYAGNEPLITQYSTIGHEININNKGTDIGWQNLMAPGNSRGLVIVTADSGPTPAQHALYVGKHTGTGGWYTGILNDVDAIVPNTEEIEIGNNELYRLKGGSLYSKRYGGIRFHTGHFRYGISLTECTIADDCAILLAKDHSIVFGTRPSNGTYITWTAANMFNVQGAASIGWNGVLLLREKKPGWGVPTGVATRTAFDTSTVTTSALAERVKALIEDLTSHHGLIGA